MTYLMVASGLALLLVGAEFLVRGAVALAQRLSVPPLVIGLTIVAFGTSSPELVVSLDAVMSGAPEIAVGNVVGSNIANILLVLGLSAIIFPIACDAQAIGRDCRIMLVVTVGFIVLCWNGQLVIWHGAFMMFLLFIYLTWSYFLGHNKHENTAGSLTDDTKSASTRPRSSLRSIGYIIMGIVGLVYGSHMLIAGGVKLAVSAGVSEATIGLSLIAIGTSLPELATSIVAAFRRQGDMAIGNVIGSNLFNILGIMGMTAFVQPVPIADQFFSYDLWVMLSAAILVAPFIMGGRQINRRYGILLTAAYLIYLVFLYQNMLGTPKTESTQAAVLTTSHQSGRILPAFRQLVTSIDSQLSRDPT